MELILLRFLTFILSFWMGMIVVGEYHWKHFSEVQSNPIIIKVYARNKVSISFSPNKTGSNETAPTFIDEDEAIKQIMEFMHPVKPIIAGSSVQFTRNFVKNDYKQQAEINETISLLNLRLCKMGVAEVYLLESRGICGATWTKQICGN
jgi:hypothetical protein